MLVSLTADVVFSHLRCSVTIQALRVSIRIPIDSGFKAGLGPARCQLCSLEFSESSPAGRELKQPEPGVFLRSALGMVLVAISSHQLRVQLQQRELQEPLRRQVCNNSPRGLLVVAKCHHCAKQKRLKNQGFRFGDWLANICIHLPS